MVHKGWKAGTALLVALAITGCTSATNGSNSSVPPNNQRGGDRPGVGRQVDPTDQPDSTFGLDIDTASYYYARRQLLDGNRPDPSTVRPEEFVNAFRQDYPQPAGDGFTVTIDGARLPSGHRMPDGGGDARLLRIGLQTRGDSSSTRPDAALTFVIDVSAHYPRKREALACYRSQFAPNDETAVDTRLTAPTFRQLIESRDAQFGALAGVAFAEGIVVREPVVRASLLKDA